MNLTSTSNCSHYEQLLKKIKALLVLAVFTVSSFNVSAQSTSLISACGDFVSGPSAWPYVLVATTVADGATSQGSQTYTMNVTTLPASGANVRVYKTTANGSAFFGSATALTLGSNTITVAGVSFDRAVKFQFSSGDVEFDDLTLNGVASTCVTPPPPPVTSLISACGDFIAGPSAWPYVLVATTVADGATSQGPQTYTMNVTTLPASGANVRVFKTTANGSSFFGNAIALTLGSNTITVAGVSFDRAVKFQFSSGDVEFDDLTLNGVASTCVAPTPLPATSLISACGDFIAGPSAWPYVLEATTVADGVTSQGPQTYTMNVTTLPASGANYRVAKTTANGNWFFGNATALTLGSNTITVAGVSFDRAVKFQFSSGDVEFDALSVNGVASSCVGITAPVSGCTDPLATNYDASATIDDGSCVYPVSGCTDPLATNYNVLATVDDGSCVYPVPGCTDPLATNYNALATVDDGSCSYLVQCCNSSAYGSAIAPTSGIVTISTCNYLSEYSTISSVAATTVYGLNVTGVNANPGWITVYEGSVCGNIVAEGSAPLTFTSLGSGTYYVHWGVDNTCITASGCHTTSMAYGGFVSGCTDPIATNYDPSANVDDGSCAYILGCTDSLATNYDPLATQDDGSCSYPACSVPAPVCEDFNSGALPICLS